MFLFLEQVFATQSREAVAWPVLALNGLSYREWQSTELVGLIKEGPNPATSRKIWDFTDRWEQECQMKVVHNSGGTWGSLWISARSIKS
jgi:hypothetical protein